MKRIAIEPRIVLGEAKSLVYSSLLLIYSSHDNFFSLKEERAIQQFIAVSSLLESEEKHPPLVQTFEVSRLIKA